MKQRRRLENKAQLSENVLRWVTGLLLLALLGVAVLQHRWLEQLHKAQLERRAADLTDSLEDLRDAFDRRFFNWVLTHEVALAELSRPNGRVSLPLDDFAGTVRERYYRWQEPTSWLALTDSGTGRPLDQPPAIVTELPTHLESLVPYPVDTERLALLLAEVPPPDALATRLQETRASGNFPSLLESPGPVMLILFDRQRFSSEFLAPLADRFLARPEAPMDFALIEHQGDNERMVYRSTPQLKLTELDPPDGEIRLLRLEAMLQEASSAMATHSSSAPALGLTLFYAEGERSWIMRVRNRDGSVTKLIDRLRTRNLMITLSGLVVLGGAVLLLAILAIRAQRLARAQMEFVSSVSHELRTPLSVMASAASNLAGGVVETPDQVKSYGDLMRQETRRLQELMERVLTFARLDEGTLEASPVSVNRVVERVVATHAERLTDSDLELEIKLPENLPPALADATALESVLSNLLDNAIRHGASGNRVLIEASVQAEELRLSVRDWGDGIAPGEQKRLFDAFYRGRNAREQQTPGTGLGLSLVKRITQASGGRVSVESTPGVGSTFALHLPLADTGGRPS